jgi:hypothetical protein
MEYLSVWHDSDLCEGSIRPLKDSIIQVRCSDGAEVKGRWFRGAFRSFTPMRSSVITGWRHIEGVID